MDVLPTNSCVTHKFTLHDPLKIAPYTVSSGDVSSYTADSIASKFEHLNVFYNCFNQNIHRNCTNLRVTHKSICMFVRSQRREAVGIPTLSSNGSNHVTDSAKAEALNNQSSSVFTCENLTNVPSKPESPFNSITDLDIELPGVVKQLV